MVAAHWELLRKTLAAEFKEGRQHMIGQAILPPIEAPGIAITTPRSALRKRRFAGAPNPFRFPSYLLHEDEETEHRQAELFYLQKQIQTQTPMVIVLEDGEQLEGCIEWYDRRTLKVRGRQKMLIFKSAIKYMYKQGEIG
jgi:sRNA-binding regulator protein Hfq